MNMIVMLVNSISTLKDISHVTHWLLVVELKLYLSLIILLISPNRIMVNDLVKLTEHLVLLIKLID